MTSCVVVKSLFENVSLQTRWIRQIGWKKFGLVKQNLQIMPIFIVHSAKHLEYTKLCRDRHKVSLLYFAIFKKTVMRTNTPVVQESHNIISVSM